jgi:hypothetical protein
MINCKVAYYVNDNIQHFPPVYLLQQRLPGIIIVRGESILAHIQQYYPEAAARTFFIRSRSKAKAFLKKNLVRVVVYPAFQSLDFALSVEIFHGGLSDKRYLENAFISLYDLVLFPGKKSVDKVAKAKLLEHVANYEVIGYPKFDPLINNNLAFAPLFSNCKPTVLYAPTWISINKPGASQHKFSLYGESSLPLWGLEILKKTPETVNLIVKFHCVIHEDGNSINKQMERFITEHQLEHRIKIVYQDNILPFMAQADVMISDISSACYEWFHFNKPIIFANPSPEHYSVSGDISANTYAWQAGDIINRSEDIARLITSNLQTDIYSKKRNEIFNYSIFQPDGCAIERQVKAITQLLKKYEATPYRWFTLKCTTRHFFRHLYLNLVLKRKVDKLAGLE